MPLTLQDAYKALGLDPSASEQEIKTAYKKLALLNHPDKAKPEDRDEAHKRFLLISESYKRITDPDSFKDEEDNEPSEEEMQAMFFSMFSDMMGGFGGRDFGSGFGSRGGGGGIPIEILEALMMQEMMSGGMGGFTFVDGDEESEDEGGFNPFMMGGGMGMEAFLSMMAEEEDPRRNRSHHRPGRGGPHHGHGYHSHGHKPNGNKKQPPPKKPPVKAAPPRKMPTTAAEDDEGWETDEEEKKESTRGRNTGRRPMFFEEDDDDDEDDDMEDEYESMMADEAMLYMMLNGMAGGQFDFGGTPGRTTGGRTPGSNSKKNTKKRAKAKAKKAAGKTGTDSSPAKHAESTPLQQQPQPPPPAEAKATSNDGGSGHSVPDFPSSSSAKKGPAAAPPAKKKGGQLKIGDRVLVFNKHLGTVMFVGDVHYAKGTFAGVIMDDPTVGKNNGTIRGVKYFECNGRNSGLMVAISDLAKA